MAEEGIPAPMVAIKEEIDSNIAVEELNIDIDIKEEIPTNVEEELDIKPEIDRLLQSHIETYIPQLDTHIIEPQSTQSNLPPMVEVQNCSIDSMFGTTKLVGTSDVKEEVMEYPEYDAQSMDSMEATALGNVEACLKDDENIKSEDDGFDEHSYNYPYQAEDIKTEPNYVTETQLISNKVINTMSTITNPHDGLVESQTTKTLVMEIMPMNHTSDMLSKMGNPEEILPTTNNAMEQSSEYTESEYCDDEFQLNSITGDELSLEQQALGLLKTNDKKNETEKTCPCTMCNKVYRNRSSLNRHLKVHEAIEKRTLGIMRGIQKKLKKNKIKREKKIKTECEDVKPDIKKEGYACTCGKMFQRRSRMETCMRSHDYFEGDSCLSCITCSKEFKSKDELTSHKKKMHSRKRFACKFCPTDYDTRKQLFKHLQKHQKVQLMEYKVITEIVKGRQKLKCFMCSKSFSELSELKSHVMDDHKDPFMCPKCKLTFHTIIDFANHTKTSHPDVEGQSVLDVLEAFSELVKAWKCQECELQFHEADKLALHKIEKHCPDLKAEAQFQCADCGRVFAAQKGLASHRRMHHSTESIDETELIEKGIMCLECRKMCKDINALTSHMRFHSPDRKYPCKFCDFRFATPEKRKVHAEIHTGDMKYVCFICEYQCTSENRLKRHKVSIKHINMREYLLTGKPLIVEQSTSSGAKKEEGKRKRKDIKIEKDSDISSEPVSCDICGDKFESESVMLEHKQTHPFIEFPNDDSKIFFK